ncbi:uncharacterized protein LOC123988176 [Osmia bicornis bicornis]|uniref:uncharacterized protein LOC123988176 n=1 Tax=Osmia bicornis bicornis TaxID=1437191 RepID=UPI001EAEA676|nr:uncharacterized protein LOC123988176 [Osmia bicornis bicornis]
MGADVVVISEQYRNPDCSSWYVDDLGVAALWVRDLQKVPVVCRGAGRGFVWAKSRDVTYVSVYLSPNDSTCVFWEKLDDLEDALRDMNGGLVVAGDFNARALEWGMPAPNTRGKLVMEMASRLGLIVLNTGTTPTYRRPGFGDSIPDVTLVSECLGRRAVGWRVMEDFTGSVHQYITFQISSGRAAQHRNPQRPLGWNTAKLDEEKFAECLSRGLGGISSAPGVRPDRSFAEALVSDTMRLITRACDASIPRKKPWKGRAQAYWWTDQIASLRRECLRLRRLATSSR